MGDFKAGSAGMLVTLAPTLDSRRGVMSVMSVLATAGRRLVLAAAALCAAPAWAAEGTTAAGPIGGTDIRSALLPPPGVYGVVVGLNSNVGTVKDGTGHPAAGLDAVGLNADVVGGLVAYVPNVQVLGGSIGFIGFASGGQECGQVVSSIPRRCVYGFGDPYIEADWSRTFGHVRPSRDPNAFPIVEGLTIDFGLGAVIPVGQYDHNLQAMNGVSLGNKTFDVAPSVAFTYTTPPFFAEGTEISSKIYLNSYATNPVTDYRAGPLVDVDFAVSEHFGRFQVGSAGVFLRQIAGDRQFGAAVLPDGRRLEYLAVGAVLDYDFADIGAALKFKALTTVVAENCGVSRVLVISFAKKLY